MFYSLMQWFNVSITKSKYDENNLKRRFFEKWRLLSGFLEELFRTKDYIEKKWQYNKKKLETDGRYPFVKKGILIYKF